MGIRAVNILGITLVAIGIPLLLGLCIAALFRGEPPALTVLTFVALGLAVVGSVGALVPDDAYRPPMRGLRRVNPFRLAHGALVFLFGFGLFAAVSVFLFWQAAALEPTLYMTAGVLGVVLMAAGGRAVFTEPDGAVYIPEKRRG